MLTMKVFITIVLCAIQYHDILGANIEIGKPSVVAYRKTSDLSSYNIKDVTVSGLSSGAYMAVQTHVAFSSVINGSAIFAGGPYFCAEANLLYAEDKCMSVSLGTPDVSALISYTSLQAGLKTIDNPLNMKDDRVYLFSGSGDSVVNPKVMKSLQEYYEAYVDVSQLVADYNVNAEHCFPTLSNGEVCSRLSSPYIGKCSFDGAGQALETLYGPLIMGSYISSNLLSFSQKPFIEDSMSSLADTGYIYVPGSCAAGDSCHLHISFHGCLQDEDSIGNIYATDTGFNGWAEANGIIVLYPYAKKSNLYPSNPNGCWDWWGYSSLQYAVQGGVQMKFVKNLIDHLSGV